VETLIDAVIDTVALIHHLDDSLPKSAEELFRAAEAGEGRLYLPEVALGEFAYLALRGRLGIQQPRAIVEEVVNTIRGSGYIQACPLGPDGWDSFLNLEIPELHDRMIAAAAISRELPLISNDRAFERVRSLTLIWR
jgi:predicted nucleic acid-binding protein